MYTSGRTVKSTGRRPNTGLTVQKATRDARRIVERIMPGVGATVNSRPGWDLKVDRATIVTTITFPPSHAQTFALWVALFALPGNIGTGTQDSARMVITRTV